MREVGERGGGGGVVGRRSGVEGDEIELEDSTGLGQRWGVFRPRRTVSHTCQM